MCSKDGQLKSKKEKFKSSEEQYVTSSNKDGCSKGEQSNNGDKKCEENKYMWPVKPQMDVQSRKSTIKSSNNKLIGLNKNCKATISCKKQKKCEYDDSRSQSTMKKCSEGTIRCRFLILLNKSWSKLVFSGTVHWFCSKTSFQLLL